MSLYGESDTALKRIIKFIKKKKACSKRENLNDAALASKENESGISGKEHFHNGVKIKWHIFLWFSLFTAIVLIILWLCQVVFLDAIYKNIKTNEITRTGSLLKNSIDNSDFDTLAETVGRKNDICLLILRMTNDKEAVEIFSVEALRSCLIHNAEKNSIFVFYDYAKNNGGSSIQHFRYSSERKSYISSESPLYELLPADNESIIYSEITADSDGNTILLLLNSVISPVNATVSTLNRLLSVISVVLVLLALIMSLLISRKIAKPIVKLSSGAKQLATGNYNVNFTASGYREIGELARALDYAEHELSKVDALRRELIANISQDLRTPLTMISGYAEIMRDIPNENSPENLQIIIDESNRLTSLVNDVLDISKLEAGVRTVTPSCFSLTEAIKTALLRYNKLMEQKGYIITFEPQNDITVNTDKTLLMQVFYNLINNALTYTGSDKRIYVSQTIKEDDKLVRISVTDTGDGIAPEKLHLIWDRYYKVDKVHKRAAVGTGLGLSIVRSTMDLLGGSYGVSSSLGNGSTFWFEIKYETN